MEAALGLNRHDAAITDDRKPVAKSQAREGRSGVCGAWKPHWA
jgi:hypothetical protein